MRAFHHSLGGTSRGLDKHEFGSGNPDEVAVVPMNVGTEVNEEEIVVKEDEVIVIDDEDEELVINNEVVVIDDDDDDDDVITISDDEVTGGVTDNQITMDFQETAGGEADSSNEFIVGDWKVDDNYCVSSLESFLTILDRPWHYNKTIPDILNDNIENYQTGKVDTDLTI